MVSKIYPAKLQLNTANTSNIEASFFGLALILFISDDIVSAKLYDKREEIDFKLSISLF